MASINRVRRDRQRETNIVQRYKDLAALFVLFQVLDAYQLTHMEGGEVRLRACKETLSIIIERAEIGELIQPLGEWLATLPKPVWD